MAKRGRLKTGFRFQTTSFNLSITTIKRTHIRKRRQTCFHQIRTNKMKTKAWRIEEGAPYPMGVSLTEEGANFALFSIHAEKVELCLFDKSLIWKFFLS